MMAYVLEYEWVSTQKGWRLRSEGHEALLDYFEFRQTDARFLHSTLTPDSFQEMKEHLDRYGLNPRVFNVLSSNDWNDAYCVLRFPCGQSHEALLAKLFCS